MRKSLTIGIVAAVLIAAGVTIGWIGIPGSGPAITAPVALAQETDLNQGIADSGQAAIKTAIAEVGPAVVRVDVSGTMTVENPFSDMFNDPLFRHFFGSPFDNGPQQRKWEGVGSGVVLEYGGEKLVLTNAHVIENADEIRITDVSGNSYNATVVGSDELLDVAVLRIDGDTSGIATAVLGDSDTVEIGDWAIAIGNPLGLSYTVTLGIISATNRDIAKPSGIGAYNNLIQTDAAINPGNSGGPLVNAQGEVIGINTMIARETSTGIPVEGINFAVAINGVKDVLDQLVRSGKVTRGWLGVQVTDITPETAQQFGVDPSQEGALIAHVYPGDPADLGGMKEGDVVVRIGDTRITSADDLVREIALLGAGTTVDIEVIRDGSSVVLNVTLGERPSEEELANYQGKTEATAKFGITVGPITSIIAEHLGLNSTDGVVIMEIAAGSRADQAGLRAGDVILEIDHQGVTSVEDWNRIVSGLSEDDHPTLTILRNGQLGFVRL